MNHQAQQRTQVQPMVAKIKNLAASERKITAEILECIREISNTKIFLEMGYPSMLEFLVKECGYSESAALRRISSAKILQDVPEIRIDLQNGDLNLTQVSVVAQAIRQVEKTGKDVTPEKKKEVLEALKNKRSTETQMITAQMLDLPVMTFEKQRTQADESTRIEFVLSKEEMEMVKKAREILGHVKPGMSVKDLLVHVAEEIVKKKDPAREPRAKRDPTRQPGAQRDPSSEAGAMRSPAQFDTKDGFNHRNGAVTVPARVMKTQTPSKASFRTPIKACVRRFVFQRDRVCQWKDPKTGRKCESRHLLEIDHVHPRWQGGGNEIENLRVLCRNHNQWRFRNNLP